MEAPTLPMWLNCLLGFLGAIGGFEGIKYLLNLRSNKRKDNAGASSAEADAIKSQMDAQAAIAEYFKENIEYFQKQSKQIAEENQQLREEIRQLRVEFNQFKQTSSKREKEDSYKITTLERQVKGLQTQKKRAERFFCEIEKCDKRKPPFGTYVSPNIEPATV